MVADFFTMTPEEIAEKYDVVDGEIPGKKFYIPKLTPAEQRQEAYVAEADPLFREALYYQAEAAGLLLLGKQVESETMTEKAQANLVAYAAKKEEIRHRHPDLALPAPNTQSAAHEEDGASLYCLNASGVYHAAQCLYATETGAWLSLTEIAATHPGARACTRCNPPEHVVGEG